MTTIRSLTLAALACAFFVAGCNCGGNTTITTDGGEDSGFNNCTVAGCNPNAGHDGGDEDGGADAGEVDAGPPIVVDPNDPNNAMKDSDCDGLSDAEEFANTYAGGKKTDPAKADSDGDGIKDGVELGRTSSVDPACTGFEPDGDPATKTSPVEVDSDGDGLSDGIEDANHDGAVSVGETDPNSPDSDGDKIADGAEDVNGNGIVDPGETDPRKKDTDGDGINDGVEKTITLTDPTKADTDGDGCLDGAEDGNQNGQKDLGETDPKNGMDCGTAVKDTDNDGLPDSIEDVNGNGVYDPGLETDLNNPDTDGDGLKDGQEDKDHNGQVNAGETNPRRKDSDCDGLIDGPTQGATLGEDQNSNGIVDANETDPTKADTDGDGISDGVERGITANPDPTFCPGVILDADPTTTTDPTKVDTDGDGIADGAEDTNQNGKVDSGELDPKNAADGTGPAGQVCTANNLRPVLFKSEGTPDIQLGLPDTFAEVTPIVQNGTTKGMMGYDSTRQVAFLVYRVAAPAANVTADEASIRGSLGAVSNVNTQAFTTWDGFSALQGFYDSSATADLKAQANTLAVNLLGTGAGVLVGNAGVTGPFKLQAEYVHRSAQSLVVLIALAKQTDYTDLTKQTLFSISDAAGGSALAQFGDANAVQCEVFNAGNSLVDFLFVVDDSGSMASYQTQLATAATAMTNKLNTTSLDYRLGLVTTSYPSTANGIPNKNVLRGFTKNVNEFSGWLTQNNNCTGGFCSASANTVTCTSQDQCWVTISGDGTERALEAARKATEAIAPATANSTIKVRPGAQLVIVVLGDADDQNTAVSAQTYSDYFNNAGNTLGTDKNTLGQKIPVHGIICPVGQTCNETQSNPQRTRTVVTNTQGVVGDINDPGGTSIATTINTIVDSAIAAAGYKTKKPPIGASVKVAMNAVVGATCNKNDLPRSRVNGFDVDGKAGTISFFGDCRPAANNTPAAVSYRYWIDTTPSPNGNPPPCSQDTMYYDPNDPDHCKGNLVCNNVTNLCECPSNCGGTPPPGKVCNPNKLVCDFVCTPDCGGTCSGYQTCDQTTCGCVCIQNATCAPGFTFINNGTQCGCFCNTTALNCGATYDADPNSCACVCKPNCGGCPTGQSCNASSCSCGGGIG